MDTTDLELLAAWREGNRRAGGELFDRHFAAIRRFFRSKVGDDYEDLLQSTFARCVDGHHRFRGDGTFRSYLFAIASNVLREHIRGRRVQNLEFDPDRISVVDLGLPGPSTAIGAQRERQLLLTALRRLALNDQIVIELFYWEQMRSAEIADVIGLPHGTVRSRLRLARERLRGQLDELARDPAEAEATAGGLERWAAELRRQLDA